MSATKSEDTTQERESGSQKDQTAKKHERRLEERDPVNTSHELALGRKTLGYQVTFGALPIRNEWDEVEAHIYFTAYIKDRAKDEADRPLTFTFNGGPGSSSIWLHLGGLGPKRVDLLDDGDVPPGPHRLVPNQETWLDQTDLVFIDPVGTGFSRAKTEELDKKFWGIEGDIDSIAEAIRLYLTRYGRWTSPLFLCGESYGTFRAAGLASKLFDMGIPLSGISLVSSILNMQTARFGPGNDLPFALFLPTYTATAWFHKALPRDLQSKSLRDVLNEVEHWIVSDYWSALYRGDTLQGKERDQTVSKLARYTGLSEQYVSGTRLRVNIHRFCKELLRDRDQTVGRIDSRFTGRDLLNISEHPDFDPSLVYPGPPYTSVYQEYVRKELGWETDQPFETMSNSVWKHWDSGSAGKGHPDTSEALREAMTKFRSLEVWITQGYYDLATPYYATQYTVDHLGLAPEFQGNIQTTYYEAGHMMYIDRASREKLKDDAVAFFKRAARSRK